MRALPTTPRGEEGEEGGSSPDIRSQGSGRKGTPHPGRRSQADDVTLSADDEGKDESSPPEAEDDDGHTADSNDTQDDEEDAPAGE